MLHRHALPIPIRFSQLQTGYEPRRSTMLFTTMLFETASSDQIRFLTPVHLLKVLYRSHSETPLSKRHIQAESTSSERTILKKNRKTPQSIKMYRRTHVAICPNIFKKYPVRRHHELPIPAFGSTDRKRQLNLFKKTWPPKGRQSHDHCDMPTNYLSGIWLHWPQKRQRNPSKPWPQNGRHFHDQCDMPRIAYSGIRLHRSHKNMTPSMHATFEVASRTCGLLNQHFAYGPTFFFVLGEITSESW